MFNKKKKRVIAYLHTHWDREWYREFEIFRLRLLRVFDNVLDMLEHEKIPSFYFDGQVVALLDYLEMRPEKEQLIRNLVAKKKLYIGPFYCLVDEFLTDAICFSKNLEIGMKIAREFGCNDFIGYLADTFGHSINVPIILKDYGIDKAVVWRGAGDLPSEFIFNGVNTVNLIRGYFNDIFASDKTIADKSQFIKKELDKIAECSKKVLLMPIGADHLGIPTDINEQIEQINACLDDYQIELGSIFDYFKAVKFKSNFDDELRDNEKTFILPGTYSTRTKLKQLNTECSYKLDLANKLQFNFGNQYTNVIEYAYKLLLKNLAHDSICGCSTDLVHEENITRYHKVLEIANGIIEEIRFAQGNNISVSFKYPEKQKLIEVERTVPEKGTQIIAKRQGFATELLTDQYKIPVTEDYTTIYTLLKEIHPQQEESDIYVSDSVLGNSYIKIEIEDGQINLYDGASCHEDFIKFVRYKDNGDTYNFGPVKDDKGEYAKILSSHMIMQGPLRGSIRIETSFFGVLVWLNKQSKLLNFKILWSNLLSDKLWQVQFRLYNDIYVVHSEDMNTLISREFDPEYNIRENLPAQKGMEAMTNTAPMQRFAWTNGFGVITKGLNEYEVYKNNFSITILRSIGIISNPDNPARTTPAGPPIKVKGAQQFGENSAEFAIGFFDVEDWANYVEEIYPQTIIL